MLHNDGSGAVSYTHLDVYKRQQLENVNVYIDSPMATTATEVFKRNAQVFDEMCIRDRYLPALTRLLPSIMLERLCTGVWEKPALLCIYLPSLI